QTRRLGWTRGWRFSDPVWTIGSLKIMPIAQLLSTFDLGQRRKPPGATLPSNWAQTQRVTRDHGQIIWQDLAPPAYEETIAAELAVARAVGAEDLEWKLFCMTNRWASLQR
ncbi:MAG: hypothetical protein ACK5WK_07655, partial [Hyphomonadaceae bacterium]